MAAGSFVRRFRNMGRLRAAANRNQLLTIFGVDGHMSVYRHASLAIFLFVTISALSAGAGLAGPWPRGKGNVFFSSEIAVDRQGGADRLSHRHYLEYGLSDHLTLGARVEQQTGWDNPAQLPPLARFYGVPLHSSVFLRVHLGEVMVRTPVAFEVQVAHNAPQDGDRVRLAAHLGHSFDTLGYAAWARLGASAGLSDGMEQGQRDMTAQLGVNILPRLRGWVDAGRIFTHEARLSRVTVSAAVDVTERFSMTLGYSRTFGGWRESGWRMGVWSAF